MLLDTLDVASMCTPSLPLPLSMCTSFLCCICTRKQARGRQGVREQEERDFCDASDPSVLDQVVQQQSTPQPTRATLPFWCQWSTFHGALRANRCILATLESILQCVCRSLLMRGISHGAFYADRCLQRHSCAFFGAFFDEHFSHVFVYPL